MRTRNREMGRILARPGNTSAPFLKSGPQLRERSEFRAAANIHANSFFKRVGIICRNADELHGIKVSLENFFALAENDHAFAGVATRSPQEIRLMGAESERQTVAAAEEVDRAG